MQLDRPGIFKAVPTAWKIRSYDSGAVAVSIQFLINAQLDGNEWVSWAEAEEHTVYGEFFVIKKDGTINQTIVTQLAKSTVCTRSGAGVVAFTWAKVVSARSQPEASSMVTPMPSSTATSRIVTAGVMPPTRVNLTVTPSATPRR